MTRLRAAFEVVRGLGMLFMAWLKFGAWILRSVADIFREELGETRRSR